MLAPPTNWVSVKEEDWCSEYSSKHLVVEQTRGPHEEHKEQKDTSEAEQYHCSCQSSIHTNPLRNSEVETRDHDVTSSSCVAIANS